MTSRGEATERTEYRLVRSDGLRGPAYAVSLEEMEAHRDLLESEDSRRRSIQTRTVTETPWVDLDEQEGGEQ